MLGTLEIKLFFNPGRCIFSFSSSLDSVGRKELIGQML